MCASVGVLINISLCCPDHISGGGWVSEGVMGGGMGLGWGFGYWNFE